MPVDHRRIRGPDESFSPRLFLPSGSAKCAAAEDRRSGDGARGNMDVRAIFARCGLVSQAKGSAYIEAGNTKVICSVYGPRETERRDETEMKRGKLLADVRLAPFSCRKRGQWIQGTEEKDLSQFLLESLRPGVLLQKYPRSQIEVCVMVLENDGAFLAHAVTCASLALADAGIEMYDVVMGCAARRSGDAVLLDPTFAEEHDEHPSPSGKESRLTLALMPAMNQVSGLQAEGEMDAESLVEAARACMEGCYKLYPVVQQTLLKSVRKKAPPPES
ncbi:exosome complex component MTR3 [Denticeps clupeoides]|uniref:Exosome complex component MTR3 n=1 Tax=Denticeps clupeoides TaxID=299321 RepID=A0AAY4DGM4_9TELE|nr:exosome complex component MTR3 [Denticeps clupeoides]